MFMDIILCWPDVSEEIENGGIGVGCRKISTLCDFTLVNAVGNFTSATSAFDFAFLFNENVVMVSKVPATEILIPVGDWNGHLGAPVGVFSDTQGWHNWYP